MLFNFKGFDLKLKFYIVISFFRKKREQIQNFLELI